jgi:hypothetical protein
VKTLKGISWCFAVCVFASCGAPEEQLTPERTVGLDWSSLRVNPLPRGLGDRAMPGPRAAPPGPGLDWNVATSAPVTAAPALLVANFNTMSTSDALFFGTATAAKGIVNAGAVSNWTGAMATANFFKLKNLYATVPSVEWYGNTAGLDGSSVALSVDNTRVYALDKTGVLHCFKTTPGGTTAVACTGWTDFSTGGIGVSLSSPWVDYTNDNVFFGDLAGNLYKIDGHTGAVIWQINLGGFAVRSSPVVLPPTVYVGNDGGQFYRITDPGNTTPTLTPRVSLCGAASCSAVWAIVSSPTVDINAGYVYAAANDAVFEFSTTANPWGQTASSPKSLGTGGGFTLFSSPSIDYSNPFIYVGYFNTMFKISYPFSGGPTSGVYSAQQPSFTAGQNSYPHGGPLPFNGVVYVGDSGGRAEQYACPTGAQAPALRAQTASFGTSVETTPLLDVFTMSGTSGNINFGYANGTTAGGIVQITQQNAAPWGCPTGQVFCAAAGCGGRCVQCCTNSDCSGGTCSGNVCISSCQQTNQGDQCATANENASVTLDCGGGRVISQVVFASYGLPTGSCGSFATGNCNASNSVAVVSAACVGQKKCTVNANNATFGDPCAGPTKQLFVEVACAQGSGTGVTCSANHVNLPATCAAGVCTGTCTTGFADCNNNKTTDGCETATTADPNHCGGCTNVCSTNHIPTATCAAGVCNGTCQTGYADCNNNKLTDGCETLLACGSCCGTTCGAGTTCISGTCQTTPPSTSPCGTAPENSSATLTCPAGTTIQKVLYASYGLPNGTCGSFTNGTCHANNSIDVVTAACVGKSTCTVGADNTTFGDPCVGTVKRMDIQVLCGVSQGCSSNHVTPTCSAGTCNGACDTGYGDCNGNKQIDGCETATITDQNNCGGCGNTCSANHVNTPSCTAGVCNGDCDIGFADCNHNKLTDGCEGLSTCNNCCGVACTTNQACINGTCTAVATTTVCGTAPENSPVTLSCPSGSTITSINYASYGTPTGTCPSFTNSTCNATTSTSVVTTACLNKASCTVNANNATFGDPCVGTLKNLDIRVTCTPTTVCP